MEENTSSTNLFVIDASYILAALMPDEKEEIALNTIIEYKNKNIFLASTTLLPYEVANSLRSNINRGRIAYRKAMELLTEFGNLQIPFYPIEYAKYFAISCKYNISCYDASYVALAKEKGAGLLTFDKRLKEISDTRYSIEKHKSTHS